MPYYTSDIGARGPARKPVRRYARLDNNTRRTTTASRSSNNSSSSSTSNRVNTTSSPLPDTPPRSSYPFPTHAPRPPRMFSRLASTVGLFFLLSTKHPTGTRILSPPRFPLFVPSREWPSLPRAAATPTVPARGVALRVGGTHERTCVTRSLDYTRACKNYYYGRAFHAAPHRLHGGARNRTADFPRLRYRFAFLLSRLSKRPSFEHTDIFLPIIESKDVENSFKKFNFSSKLSQFIALVCIRHTLLAYQVMYVC